MPTALLKAVQTRLCEQGVGARARDMLIDVPLPNDDIAHVARGSQVQVAGGSLAGNDHWPISSTVGPRRGSAASSAAVSAASSGGSDRS